MQNFTILAALSFCLLSGAVQASSSVPKDVIADLSEVALRCAEQPFTISRSGHKILQPVRSHCEELQISRDRAEFRFEGRVYTVLVKESAFADEGDLDDVFLQYDSREDQEVALARNILAFDDPIVGVLIVAGKSPELLPQIAVSQ